MSVTVAGLNIRAKTKISPEAEQKYFYQSYWGKKHYKTEMVPQTLKQVYIIHINSQVIPLLTMKKKIHSKISYLGRSYNKL